MSYTVTEIAERVQGTVVGEGATRLSGFSPAATAKAGDLTFAESPEYFSAAEESAASAILVSGEFTSASKVLIRVRHSRIAMARVLPIFFPPEAALSGIDPSAKVAASAEVDTTAHIGPGCVIGERVRIGARANLMGGNHIGSHSSLGEDVCLHPNVVVYAGTVIGHRVTIHAGTTIGSDGYSYVFDEGRHRKVLQVGNVVIHDDVEIGSNTSIDRAALGSTVIGAGTKIDNLVHVAHNVVIGSNCLIMGQVGFAGSTQIGDYTVIASQTGISGHLKIGRQVTVGAKSGVMRDIPDGATVVGVPAQPGLKAKRQWVAVEQLPDLIYRFRKLERQVGQLSAMKPPSL
ncbi:UDP-3-O-(3-hydroxymyristoyl)glucosamine N-acyltransferase [soil metagenome]